MLIIPQKFFTEKENDFRIKNNIRIMSIKKKNIKKLTTLITKELFCVYFELR